MTPDLKAKELVDKFYSKIEGNTEDAKVCANMCVDEIITTLKWPPVESTFQSSATYKATVDYWQQVKTSIESL